MQAMEQSSQKTHGNHTQTSAESNTEINLIPPSFYFNPGIYFACKFCRHSFPTVDTLLKHKRRKHTWSELKEIKFILFEERFVQDEFFFQNSILPEVGSHQAIQTKGQKAAVCNLNIVTKEKGGVQKLLQDESKQNQVSTATSNKEETVLLNSETVACVHSEESGNESDLNQFNLNLSENRNSSILKQNPYVI